MNWIMLPVMLVYVTLIYLIRQKVRDYLLLRMVRKNILKTITGYQTDLIIHGYNIAFAFILLPILFMGVSLFLGYTTSYNWLYSFVAYGMSIAAL